MHHWNNNKFYSSVSPTTIPYGRRNHIKQNKHTKRQTNEKSFLPLTSTVTEATKGEVIAAFSASQVKTEPRSSRVRETWRTFLPSPDPSSSKVSEYLPSSRNSKEKMKRKTKEGWVKKERKENGMKCISSFLISVMNGVKITSEII